MRRILGKSFLRRIWWKFWVTNGSPDIRFWVGEQYIGRVFFGQISDSRSEVVQPFQFLVAFVVGEHGVRGVEKGRVWWRPFRLAFFRLG